MVESRGARRPTRRGVALGSILVALVAVTAVADGSAATGTPTSAAAQLLPQRRIDRTDKAEVKNAYFDRLMPTQKVKPGWTGSVSGCRLGTESQASRDATLAAINYFRDMAGVGPVANRTGWNTASLQAALMMDAANTLSHFPSSSWPCYTSGGATAARNSNIYWSSVQSGAYAIPQYIVDEGSNNAVVGHRRWLLNSAVSYVGIGSTDQGNAIWVLPNSSDPMTAGPNIVAWPPSGYVPTPTVVGTDAANLEATLGRWSLAAEEGSGISFAGARVSATLGREALQVTVESRDTGITPSIVWNLRRSDGSKFRLLDELEIDVTVSNISVRGTATTKRYTVNLVPAFRPLMPEFTLTGGNDQMSATWEPSRGRGAPVTAYRLELFTADGTWSPDERPVYSKKVGPDVRSTTITGIAGGRPYYAWVIAMSEAGESTTNRISGAYVS